MRWILDLLRRRRIHREIAEEVHAHIDEKAAELIESGVPEPEARLQARREFGNPALITQTSREAWGWTWLERFGQDLRYGLRMLRRSPGFTAVAVFSLALGIGANTAIFSVVDALLLRTLPVRSAEQLFWFDPVYSGRSNNGIVNYAAFQRLRDLGSFFSDVAAVLTVDRSNLTIEGAGGGADPGQVRVALATGNYFQMLGVQTSIGRAFTPDEDRALGANPVAVISDSFWQRRLARDPTAVGRRVSLNGTTYTVLGVAPRGFSGERTGRPVDLWVPATMLAQVMIELPKEPPGGNILNRMNYLVLARIKPDVLRSQAQAAAEAAFQKYQRDLAGPKLTPLDERALSQVRLRMESAARGFSPQRESFAQPLAVLMMMVGAVILIACANIANLLLARSAARQREMAVRLAIGAGASRIVRQLLTESVLLASMGGALGLLFAKWGADVLVKYAATGPMRSLNATLTLDVHPDARVLLFTAALALITGILFGLAPALRASKVSISPVLSERGGSSRGRAGLGKLLVVSQVALSVLLLIGAGLFARTLHNLKTENLGFDRRSLLVAWIAPGQTGRWGAQAASLYHAIEERLGSLPGVIAVSPSVYGMLQGNTNPGTFVNVPGYAPASDDDLRAQWSIVGVRFFETMGLHLVAGRNFTERDTAKAPQVAIVNETTAQHFFPHEDPLGKHFESWGITKEIIGVVQDSKYESPREHGRRMFYLPYQQQLGRLSQTVSIAVRTRGNPAVLQSEVRAAIRSVDRNLPVLRIETVEDQLDNLLGPERMVAALSGFFGGLAVLLACLGLYGVMAYTTVRRTNEIGVRLALGATHNDVLGMVLKESLLLVALGIGLGIPVAMAATRLMAARLYGVSAMDPATIIGATLLMIAVAALAGFLPAWRAARVDPVTALRYE